MAEWQFVLTAAAEKSLKRLSRDDAVRVRDAIDALPKGDVKRLRGREAHFRLRVGGLRVVFTPDFAARQIVVLDIFPRGEGYR